MVHNVLPTQDILYKYGISRLVGCFFCKEKESISHLFYGCRIVAPVMEFISDILSSAANVVTLNLINVIYFNDLPSFFDDNLLRLYAILIGEAKFTIWSLRNEAKFQKKEVTAFLLKTFFIENVKRRIRLDFERISLSKLE